MVELPGDKRISTICQAVLPQYRVVTDGQTDIFQQQIRAGVIVLNASDGKRKQNSHATCNKTELKRKMQRNYAETEKKPRAHCPKQRFNRTLLNPAKVRQELTWIAVHRPQCLIGQWLKRILGSC